MLVGGSTTPGSSPVARRRLERGVLREEAFVDSSKIEAVSGLTYGVTRPTNNPGNPVYAGNNSSYDRHAVYIGAAKVGSRLHAMVGAWDDNWGLPSTGIACTYIYSDDDGDTWVKPSLGLISYGGNTNNNILLGGGPLNVSPNVAAAGQNLLYEPSNTDYPWLIPMTHVTTNSGALTHRIYGFANPGDPLTLIQNMGTWSASVARVGGGTNTVRDIMSLVRRPDGRWLAYYQETSAVERRSVGVMLSDQTTLNSSTTWANYGVPTGLLATQPYDQNYYAYAWLDGEVICLAVLKFSGGSSGSLSDYYNIYPYGTFVGTNDRQWKFELWTSRATDGVSSFTLLDADWYWAGSGVGDNTPGEWNAGAIKPGAMVRLDDVDRFFTCGSSEVHHPLAGRDNFVDQHRVGYADMRREGIGKVSGTGTVTLKKVRGACSGKVMVNSTGTVKVELLNPATGEVIPGFAQTDCDAISADTTGAGEVVTWNESARTPASFKAKVYATSGVVHRVKAGQF